MTINRASGIAIVAFALAMIAFIIPGNTETVGSGWMRPDTLPLACCVLLLGFGGIQAVMNSGRTDIGWRSSVRFGCVLSAVAISVYLMQFTGFLPAAIALMILLMLVSGERRPALIGAIGFGLPLVTWLVVSELIGRPLP